MTIKNKHNFAKVFLSGMLIILLIGIVSSAGTYCCEKTKVQDDGSGGFLCQNAPQEQCDTDFRMAPTSCESTSYCKKGCCYNSNEGTCIENTPESICNANGGAWEDNANCDIPRCELGCCLIGDQAAFVTQVRCKRLSALYGLETIFNKELGSEVDCIMSVTSSVEGACVFEEEFERTCLRTTKKECLRLKESSSNGSTVEFYEGYLCSADTLDTNCGPSLQTTCVEGKDQVYFLDTCGNIANIYDSSKIDKDNPSVYDEDYWSQIKTLGNDGLCSLNADISNADSCGYCDYYQGSTCREYEKGIDSEAPDIGDSICRDLGCTWNGEDKIHGETWCADSSLNPGSRHFRLLCYNGEVVTEPCDDYRAQICEEDVINTTEGDFSVAACRVNRWQDCTAQDEKEECNDTDVRDCTWLTDIENIAWDLNIDGICVPKFSPGFDFWTGDTNAEEICELADKQCVVKYVRRYKGVDTEGKGVFDSVGGIWSVASDILSPGGGDKWKTDWEVETGEECVVDEDGTINSDWKTEMETLCHSMGDCGGSMNYQDKRGDYDFDDLVEIGGKMDYEELAEELGIETDDEDEGGIGGIL